MEKKEEEAFKTAFLPYAYITRIVKRNKFLHRQQDPFRGSSLHFA